MAIVDTVSEETYIIVPVKIHNHPTEGTGNFWVGGSQRPKLYG